MMRRRYQVPRINLFETHYNHSLGAEVTSRHQMREKLKRTNDELYELSGYPSNLVEVGPCDVADTVTEEGMDSTERVARNSGWTTPTRTHIT